MKTCPNCKAALDDLAVVCPNCGAQFVSVPAYVDPSDHTAEFAPEDVAKNRLYAMLCYLTSVLGIIIALLAAKESPFLQFHIRQVIRLTIAEALVGLAAVVLCWTIIVPVAAGIAIIVLAVIEIICFFQVCAGKSKEAPIIRNLNFLK